MNDIDLTILPVSAYSPSVGSLLMLASGIGMLMVLRRARGR
jgi:hypothetical protein